MTLRPYWLLTLSLLPFAPGAALAGDAPLLRAMPQSRGAAAAISDTQPASFVITSPQGVKVFVDVLDVPADLAPELENPRNLFIVTHDHPDHLNRKYVSIFKGKTLVGSQSVARKGSSFGVVSSGDVRVEGIASSHQDDELDGTTNAIMVIDVAGTRIVHMGDCGQTVITSEQLKIIGRVDVMIHELEDSLVSEADVVNQKAYKVLAQVAPRIIIPTHITTVDGVKLLDASYPAEIATRDEFAVTPALLAKGKRAVFMSVNRALGARAGIKRSSEL